MRLQGSKAARRYAEALFLYAKEAGTLAAVEGDLERLSVWIAGSEPLRNFLRETQRPAPVRRDVLAALFEPALSPECYRFVRYLDSKRRLSLLGDVAQEFRRILDAATGRVRGTVAAPFPLQDGEVEAISRRVESTWRCRPTLAPLVDAKLGGGFRVQVGDRVLDASFAAQLRMMRRHVLGGER